MLTSATRHQRLSSRQALRAGACAGCVFSAILANLWHDRVRLEGMEDGAGGELQTVGVQIEGRGRILSAAFSTKLTVLRL